MQFIHDIIESTCSCIFSELRPHMAYKNGFVRFRIAIAIEGQLLTVIGVLRKKLEVGGFRNVELHPRVSI